MMHILSINAKCTRGKLPIIVNQMVTVLNYITLHCVPFVLIPTVIGFHHQILHSVLLKCMSEFDTLLN